MNVLVESSQATKRLFNSYPKSFLGLGDFRDHTWFKTPRINMNYSYIPISLTNFFIVFSEKKLVIGIIWTNFVTNNYNFYHNVSPESFIAIFFIYSEETGKLGQNFLEEQHSAYRMRRGWGRRSSAERGAWEWSSFSLKSDTT